MSDSIDRVFVKAISTIRTLSTRTGYGSLPRPPLENRIRLYGLYKQATEGNVTGVMARPVGNTYEDENAKRKWDAWKEEEGISKTEAKRRYIAFLIETMKIYASGTHEARELLSELEYLWDQIKDVEPNIADEGDTLPLSFMSPAFGNNSLHGISNSVSFSGSGVGLGYDSFNESYLNQSLHHHDNPSRHSSNLRSEFRDVQLMKKEINLALRRLNEELMTKHGTSNTKRPATIGLRLWEYLKDSERSGKPWAWELLRKFLLIFLRSVFKFCKKVVLELVVLILLIHLIKYKNGIDLNLRLSKFEDKTVRGYGVFNKMVFKFFKYSKLLSLLNFNKIYINVE